MSERGFTIIEVMVSIGIFGIVSGMMATSMVHMQRMNHENEIRVAAYSAAQQVLDNLRSENISSLPTSGSGATVNVTVGERVFQVTPAYCLNADDCNTPNIRGIRAQVTYMGFQKYSVDTVYARLQ